MILLRNFTNIFKIPELVKKILFTLGIIIIYRIGCYIPSIGINVSMLSDFISQSKIFGGILRFFDTFSGGALDRCTIFALGIQPYITASILMQLLSATVPYLETLSKEGDYGRKIINQYTRYLSLAVSFLFSLGFAVMLNNANATSSPGLLNWSGFGFIFLFVVSLMVGSAFVMWLGEQISLFGIGNGSSMLIFASIIGRFPNMIAQLVQMSRAHPIKVILVLLLFLILVASVVFIEKGDRKIPVQYARRIIGQRVYGGQSTYIPIKVNSSGVMPVIFSSALLNLLSFIISMLGIKWLSDAISYGGYLYNTLEFALIIFFAYFYTYYAFNPTELADNIKKSGGFIPGIRPGSQTANYFEYILNRIVLVGAIYLAVLAILPNVVGSLLGVYLLNGTSLLIMVSVALETSAQIESYLIERNYAGFLQEGRMKNRV